jgi:putative membrane protein
MKTPIRTQLYSLLFAGATFAGGAFAQLPNSEDVPRGEMSRADVDFLTTADAANMDQLMLAKRAASRAKTGAAHSLADNVVRSYSKADDALRLLAGAKHVDLAHRPTEKGREEADALLDRHGSLDTEYIQDVAHDTDDLIAMYEGARDQSSDPDIRRYADIMLEALHDHQRQAGDLVARQNGGASAGR